MHNYYYTLESPDDITLQFESRYECGNLKKVTQIFPFEYDLQMRSDTCTKGHTQWYYFSVTNTRKDTKYRFNITNYQKPGSLVTNGMRPLMYSELLAKETGIGWHRVGEDIAYYANSQKKKVNVPYTLTFSLKFQYG